MEELIGRLPGIGPSIGSDVGEVNLARLRDTPTQVAQLLIDLLEQKLSQVAASVRCRTDPPRDELFTDQGEGLVPRIGVEVERRLKRSRLVDHEVGDVVEPALL